MQNPIPHPVYVGIDVGSISVKLAAVSDAHLTIPESPEFNLFRSSLHTIIISKYRRTNGEALSSTLRLLGQFVQLVPLNRIAGIQVTGSGGKQISEYLQANFENEFRAVAKGVGTLYPDVRTIFEMGGDNSKFLRINVNKQNGIIGIEDYEKNGDCAAGTGSFMDQQASRLRYEIEDVGDIVLKAGKASTIAGRCSVFAKSDMIHAQQKGEQPPEILKGLCEAVVRNFKSSVVRGRAIVPKVIFIGGVSANQGVVQAMKSLFDIQDEDFITGDCYAWGGAIGSALLSKESKAYKDYSYLESKLFGNLSGQKTDFASAQPLTTKDVIFLRDRVKPYSFDGKTLPVKAYLGIDIGSVSTNLVVIDENNNIIKEIYVYTQARPIEIVNQGLKDIHSELGDRISVAGIGTTGSGRELIGELIGADTIKDEITAHKTGAMYISEKLIQAKVDTIFEIGGQDSKFISIEDNIVVDFAMNEACAAGTGSFLEEQAEKLGINIKGEFSKLALSSSSPIKLGERCTVFMEKDINSFLQIGASKQDIVAGLAYSIVLNYLNRVVRSRKIGETIYFQGGTAYNDSVAAAFSIVLDKKIIVPPHNGVVGAIGAAILAKEKVNASKMITKFRGWSLDSVDYTVRHFTCRACSNFCDMQEVKVDSEKTFWGDKCSDKFRKKAKVDKKPVIPNLSDIREQILMETFVPERNRGARKIGMPRSMHFYEKFPFWNTYFSQIGFQVVLSEPTNKEIINAGVEATVAEPCFPIKVAHGHFSDLLNKNCDYFFQPNVIDAETKFMNVNSHHCPWTQTLPYVILGSSLAAGIEDKILSPTVHFRDG
ncbi:CoA activase, partial [bacterium]|nr:CoA activase [bacterium]